MFSTNLIFLYIVFYSSLQYMFLVFTSNFFYYAIKSIELMTRETLNSYFVNTEYSDHRLSGMSIPRKLRKLRNSRKFFFPSQTKYSPPVIIFVHGVNPYLQFFFFRWVRKATFCRFRNRRKFLNLEDFSLFFIKVLKVLLWYYK